MSTKIAIIEDDQAISTMYRIKFEAEGYTVQTAANGKLGVSLVEEMKPDIILLDLMMPERDGQAALVKIRKSAISNATPVIILTNVSRDEAPHSLRFLGVSRYIVKAHYTPKQLVETIHSVLATHR